MIKYFTKQLNKRFILEQVYSLLMREHPQTRSLRCLVTLYFYRSRRDSNKYLCSASFILSLQFSTPPKRMVLCSLRLGLSPSLNMINVIPHRHTQKLNSSLQVCLETCLLSDSRFCQFGIYP